MTEDQAMEKAFAEQDEIFMARNVAIQKMVDSQLAAARLKLKLAQAAYDAEAFEVYHLSDRATSAAIREYMSRSCVSKTHLPTLDQVVARMKAEVLDDMVNELVPRTCASFSELHDYVDANCYGGLCNMEFSQQYGHPSEDGYPQELVDLISKAQSIIDTWLRDGGTNSNQSCVSETQQGETK